VGQGGHVAPEGTPLQGHASRPQARSEGDRTKDVERWRADRLATIEAARHRWEARAKAAADAERPRRAEAQPASPWTIRLSDSSIVRISASTTSRSAGARRIRSRLSVAS